MADTQKPRSKRRAILILAGIVLIVVGILLLFSSVVFSYYSSSGESIFTAVLGVALIICGIVALIVK